MESRKVLVETLNEVVAVVRMPVLKVTGLERPVGLGLGRRYLRT